MAGRTNSEVLAIIREVEAAIPCDTWQIEGLPVWPLIRCRLMFALSRDPAARPMRQVRVLGQARTLMAGQLQNLGAWARTRVADRSKEDRPRTVDFMFLSHSTCRTRIGGSWVDMFYDPLADALEADGVRCASLELFIAGQTRYPRYRPSALVDDRLTLVDAKAVARSLAFGARGLAEPFEQLRAVLARLGCADCAPDPRATLLRARAVEAAARYYEHVLRRSGARVAGVVNWYQAEMMAFCLACRRCGVPVIDIQHGTQSSHAAYVDWTRVPPGGFSLLPSHFWCWRGEERAAIDGWAQSTGGAHRAFVGGNLWLTAGSGPKDVLASYEQRLRERRARHPERKVVLVSLQDGRYAPREALARILAQTPPQFEFWLRLHPAGARDRERVRSVFGALLGDRCELDWPTDWPLPLLLRYADVHATLCSSVVIEAALVGVPSVVMDAVGVDLFRSEAERGLAVSAIEPEAFSPALLQLTAADRATNRLPPAQGGIAAIRQLLAAS